MAETVWSADDLEDLNCAIKKKANGERVVAETLGEKMRQYADASLSDLLELRDRMLSEIGASSTLTQRRSRILRTRYDKGL